MNQFSGEPICLERVGTAYTAAEGLQRISREFGKSIERPKQGDLFVRIGDSTVTPPAPADIPLGGVQTMAWPMDPTDKTLRNGSRPNRVLLLRLDPGKLSPGTKSRAADGVIAYTAICTHTGCAGTDWVPDEPLPFCPCHESKFEPEDVTRVVDGPAPRILPALPLKLVKAKLLVSKPFTSPVTFDAQ